MSNIDVNRIVSAIVNALPGGQSSIALHEPSFKNNEWQYVKDCIDSGWVSSVGAYVTRFEKQLAEYTGSKHVIAVVNGTAALHSCLKLINVQADDEILVPTLTFVATVNAVRYCNAIPHFVDASTTTLGIDVEKLRDHLKSHCKVVNGRCINTSSNRVILAIIAVHIFGHPVDLDALIALCEEYQIILIEDAAESLGSTYKNRHTGTFGRISAMSFNGNKIITSGGGGAILTNDSQLAARAKHITTTAKLNHAWEFSHDEVALNYRMPNINAALLCAQLEQLDSFLKYKLELAQAYASLFQNIEGVTLFLQPDNACSNNWLNILLLNEADISIRNSILDQLHQHNILVRPAWNLMHTLPMFTAYPRMDLSIANDLFQRIICLPSSAFLKLNV